MLSDLNREATALLRLLDADGAPQSATPDHLDNLKTVLTMLAESKCLDEVRNNSIEVLEKAKTELPTAIKYYCEVNELQLSGAYPDYIIAGVLYLGINSKGATVTLGDSKYPLFPIEPVFARIPDELSKHLKPLHAPLNFLERLWTAHQRCQQKQQTSGESVASRRVSVFRILPELAIDLQTKAFYRNPVKEQFKSYSQHMFRADLFRLLISEETPVVHDHRLILEPTSVSEDGLFMFLPTLGRCAFVGHVVFVPAQQDDPHGS